MTSRHALESKLDHARDMGDAATEASLLVQLGDLAKEELEYDLAQGLYGQAWAAYERAGDARGMAMTLTRIADVMVLLRPERNRRQYDAILLAFLDQSMAQFEALNDLAGQAAVWRVRANGENKWESTSTGGIRSNPTSVEFYLRAHQLYEQADDQKEIRIFFEGSNDYENQVSRLCAEASAAREPSNDELTREGSPLTFLYLEQASALYRQWGDTFKNAALVHKLGENLYQIEDYSTAYQAMKQTITMPNRDSKQGLGRIASVARLVVDYAAAQDYIEFELIDLEQEDISPLHYILTRAPLLMHRAQIKALRSKIDEGRHDYHAAMLTIYGLPTPAQIHNQATAYLFEWGKIEYAAGYRDVGYYFCSEAANRDMQRRTQQQQSLWAWQWAKRMKHMTQDLPPKTPLHRPTLESNLAQAQQSGDLTIQADCLLALGTCALDEKEYALAQGLYAQALDLYQQTNNQKGMAEALVASGNMLVYGTPADMRTAVDFFQQALKLYQAIDERMAQAHLFVRLGFLLWNMGENDARLPLYHEALALFEQIKDPVVLSPLALELAGSMYGHPEFPPLYERALKMHQKAEFERGQTSGEGGKTTSHE